MHKLTIDRKTKIIISLIVVTATLTSCATMRRKFVRQKKKDGDTQEVIPVLEPVDYPERFETPRDRYQHFFSLFKVWHKDFLAQYDDRSNYPYSDKRIIYSLDQMLLQLEGMNRLLQGSYKQKIQDYTAILGEVKCDFQTPASLRNDSILYKKVKRVGDDIRREFSIKFVGNNILGQ